MEYQKNSISGHKWSKAYLMQFKTKNDTVVDLLTDNDVYNLELGNLGVSGNVYEQLASALKSLSSEIKNKLWGNVFVGTFTQRTFYVFIGCYNPYLNGYWSVLAFSYEQNSMFNLIIQNGGVSAYTVSTSKVY